jgi:hypothetical protein
MLRVSMMSGLVAACACAFSMSRAAQIYDQFPTEIHPNERYVIFSHGLIAEGDDPRPVSPKYGVYDFPGIKQALFAGGGFNLIAVQRRKNIEFDDHVAQLVAWVRQLEQAGVRPGRITLVGFSRGGQLTAVASGRLAAEGIGTAVLAICENGDFSVDAPLALGGDFLSIYETSDSLGTCAKLAQRSHLRSFKEVAISTGKAHGAFFEPRPDWINPLRSWIAKTNR